MPLGFKNPKSFSAKNTKFLNFHPLNFKSSSDNLRYIYFETKLLFKRQPPVPQWMALYFLISNEFSSDIIQSFYINTYFLIFCNVYYIMNIF